METLIMSKPNTLNDFDSISPKNEKAIRKFYNDHKDRFEDIGYFKTSPLSMGGVSVAVGESDEYYVNTTILKSGKVKKVVLTDWRSFHKGEATDVITKIISN